MLTNQHTRPHQIRFPFPHPLPILFPGPRPCPRPNHQPNLKTILALIPANNPLHHRGADTKSREGGDLDALGLDSGGRVAAQEAGVCVVELRRGGLGERYFWSKEEGGVSGFCSICVRYGLAVFPVSDNGKEGRIVTPSAGTARSLEF